MENKSKPDIAQKEATGRALLERALRGIQKIAERLTEVENKAWEYRSVERSFRKETERSRQSTPEFSRELGNTRRAYHEAIGKIWVGVNNLNLALDNFGRAIEKAFQGLPEALAATEASEHKTIPPLEIVQGPLEKAGLLEATLLVARMDIQVLRERLRPPVSRVDERPQTASLTIPLGHIDLKTFLEEPQWKQRSLASAIRLYHAAEHASDNFRKQEWFGFLSRPLDGVPGNSVLEKTSNLCDRLAAYEGWSEHSSQEMPEQNYYPSRASLSVRYEALNEALQFELPHGIR